MRIEDFCVGGGGWAGALDRAAEASFRHGGEKVEFGCRVYSFESPPKPFGFGLNLQGGGAVGANERLGTVLQADFTDGNLLEWDGSLDYLGTGGGVSSVILQTLKPGVTALKLTGKSPQRRPGWFSINRALLYSPTPFLNGLVVDGSGAEIRDITVENSTFSNCVEENILLNNVTHFFSSCVQTMQGSGKVNSILLNQCIDAQLNGSFWSHISVRWSSMFFLSGYASSLTVDGASHGKSVGMVARVSNASPSMIVL